MRDYLIKRPMLLCGIGCCFVSIIAFYCKIAVLFICLALLLILGLMLYFSKERRVIFAAALIFLFCLTTLLTLNRIERLNSQTDTTHRLELTYIETTYKSDQYYVAEVRVEKSGKIPKGTRISVFYKPIGIKSGQKFTADVTLKNYSDESRKISGYSNSIYYTGNMSNITVLRGETNTFLSFAEKVRSYIKKSLMHNMDFDSAATLCALIFGNRDFFSDEFYGNVKNSGVSHVMVVSGMHLAILVSFLVMLMEKIFYNRFIKALAIVLTVGLITLICGFTMSVLRAGITYLLMALGIVLDRKGTPENILGAAVTFILFSAPFAIFSIALRLSLFSTFGILVVALPIINHLKEKGLPNILLGVVTPVVLSLSALLLTLPTTILTFGYFSTLSVITNILISFAVSLALYISVLGLVLNLVFPFVGEPMLSIAGIIAKYINFIINSAGSLPFATVSLPKFWGYIAILMILLVLFLLLACKSYHNVLKLRQIYTKIISEGGGKIKWHR